MIWITVALLGYFFNAVAAIFDKYLLADRIKAPAVYAFYVSLFSLCVLIFILYGFGFFGWQSTAIAFLSGVIFLYALVALYTAIKRHEISRVAPLVGTVTSLTAFVVVILSGSLQNLPVFFALILLIGGGLLISFDLPLRKGEHVPFLPLATAGIGMGISLLLLKQGYEESNFVSGLIWSRLGMFAGGLSLLLVPVFRRQILGQAKETMTEPKRATSTGMYFVLSKTCAGIGAFLIAYAISLGSVSFVQALSGMQYVFLLMLALPLSLRFPQIFGERLYFWDWFQKIGAIVLIGAGLWLSATSGVELLL